MFSLAREESLSLLRVTCFVTGTSFGNQLLLQSKRSHCWGTICAIREVRSLLICVPCQNAAGAGWWFGSAQKCVVICVHGFGRFLAGTWGLFFCLLLVFLA